MTVAELKAALGLNSFTLPNPDQTIAGGYAGDLLSWVMGRAQAGDCWITIMSNVNVAAVAVMSDVSCVLLSEGVAPDETLLQRAEQQEVNLLGSPKSTYELAAQVHALLK